MDHRYSQQTSQQYRSSSIQRTTISHHSVAPQLDSKVNLRANLDVLVVLQGFEIERLIHENDQLKFKIKDMEDKNLDRGSYEHQIRDLTLKLQEMSKEIIFYRQEVETMTVVIRNYESDTNQYRERAQQSDLYEKKCHDLQNELEQWRVRYTQLEKLKQKEIEDLRLNFEHQRKSFLEREIREINMRFQQEKSIFENEHRRIRDLLDQKNNECENWKDQAMRLDQLLSQSRLAEAKVKEYESKIGMLVQETERLNGVLRQKIEDIENWKSKYSKLEIQFRDASSFEIELRRVKDILDSKLREVEDWKNKTLRLEQQLQQLKITENQLSDQINRNNTLQAEIERLNQIIRSKLQELDEWKQKCSKYEVSIMQYRAYEQKIIDLENKCALLSQEIERLSMFLNTKNGEIEDWKNKTLRLEQLLNQERVWQDRYREVEERLNLAYQQIEDWKNKYIKLEQVIVQYQAQEQKLVDYQNKISLLTQEIERLNNIVRTKLQEIDDLKAKNQKLELTIHQYKALEAQNIDNQNKLALLTQEIERLNNLLRQRLQDQQEWQAKCQKLEYQLQQARLWEDKAKDLDEKLGLSYMQIEDWKQKYQQLEIQFYNAKQNEKRLIDYENKIALLSQEIERLNSILRQKIQENDDLKQKVSLQDMQLSKMRQLETILQDYENKIYGLQDEIQKYNNQLALKGQEIEDWKSKYIRLEGTFYEYRGIEDKLKQYESKVVLLSSEIEKLNQILRVKSSENDELKSQIDGLNYALRTKDDQLNNLSKLIDSERQSRQQYENKIALLSQEIEHLNLNISKKNQEIDQWQTRFSILQQQLDEWKNKYLQIEQNFQSLLIYKSKVQELENKLALLSAEIERLNVTLRGKQDEIDQLRMKNYQQEQTIQQLRSYEEKVFVLSQEIDRLNEIIHQLEAELGDWRLKYSEYGSLQKRITEHLALFVILFAEIESLRGRVIEKEKEVEEVRRSSLAPYRR